jgi:hypothetical protein
MSLRHISGWVEVSAPDVEPIDPGFGGGRPSPPDPDFGIGSRPPRPGNELPNAPVRPGNKPPGVPIVPPHPANKPPAAPVHPWTPGRWQIIDPGWGKPPILAFFPIDPGFGIDVDGPPPVIGGGPAPKPPGGVWVPTDPDFDKPTRPCPPAGGVPHPPIWAWVPDRPDFGGGGGKPTPAPVTTTFYPTSATVLASGGSGSVNVSTDPGGGSWTVDPTSVPSWVTISPMSSTTADVNFTYSAQQNTTGAARQASIKVNDAVFTLNQGAV